MAVPKLRPRRAQLPKLLPADDRVYASRRWFELSRAYRRQHTLCERCGEALSEHVHHKVPIRQAPALAYDLSNLEALCKACHEAEHGRGGIPPRSARGGVP